MFHSIYNLTPLPNNQSPTPTLVLLIMSCLPYLDSKLVQSKACLLEFLVASECFLVGPVAEATDAQIVAAIVGLLLGVQLTKLKLLLA